MAANPPFAPRVPMKKGPMENNDRISSTNNQSRMSETRKQLLQTLGQGGRSNGFAQERQQLNNEAVLCNGGSGGIGPRRRVPVRGENCPAAIIPPERPMASLRKKLGSLESVAEVDSENSPPPTCTTEESSFTNITDLSPREYFNARTREMLLSPSSLLSASNPSLSELMEALQTATARINRLTEYRHKQTSRNALLQQQVDQMGAELDQSVDVLRFQKAKLEAERRRANVEGRELRRQLAEAVAVMEQSKISAADGFRKTMSLAQLSDVGQDVFCSNCEKLTLDALTLRANVERLERDMERQRDMSEKDTARLRGQLAEATSDVRSLRLQLTRLSRVSSGAGEPPSNNQLLAPTTASADLSSASPCSQCHRLQKLIDVLQRKAHNQPDLVSGCPARMATPSVVLTPKSEAESQTCPRTLARSSLDIRTVVAPAYHCEAVVQTESVRLERSQVEIDAIGTPGSDGSGFVNPAPEPIVVTPLTAAADDCGDLFGLLESLDNVKSSHLTDLTTEYLEQKLGHPLTTPQHSEVVQSLMRESTSRREQQVQSPSQSQSRPHSRSNSEREVERLRTRLEILEEEVQSSADQLKESNVEFLQLRERLTNAIVERAHLKATVDGLDDQVIQLESALFERTQQLQQCKKALSDVSKARDSEHKMNKFTVIQMPIESDSEDAPLLPVSIDPVDSYEPPRRPTPRSIQRTTFSSSLINSPRLKLVKEKLSSTSKNLVPYAIAVQTFTTNAVYRFQQKLSVCHDKLGQPCNLIGMRFLMVAERLIGRSPRLSLIMFLLIYLAFLHLLLISCWLQ